MHESVFIVLHNTEVFVIMIAVESMKKQFVFRQFNNIDYDTLNNQSGGTVC